MRATIVFDRSVLTDTAKLVSTAQLIRSAFAGCRSTAPNGIIFAQLIEVPFMSPGHKQGQRERAYAELLQC